MNRITETELPLRLSFKPGIGIILLIALMVFGLTATSLLTIFMSKMQNVTGMLRIQAVIQDILVFILPAIITALLATRLSARFLLIDKAPAIMTIVVSLTTLIAAMPLINFLVEWNNSISLPSSMSHIEQAMRSLEESASQAIEMLIGNGCSLGGLIVSVLIVGVMAGFSEEIFFRGGLQRLLGFTANRHVAIWIAAFIFSAIHLQFYGFFPRLLLGAFFGYLMWWSGSLWLPVIAHIFNNSMVVIVKWMSCRGFVTYNIDELGAGSSGSDIIIVLISTVLTILLLLYLYRITRTERYV